MTYRPWGPLEWVLSLSTQKQWSFVGAIGAEERSIACWKYAKSLGILSGELLAQIKDVDSDKYRQRIADALDMRRNEFISSGGTLHFIENIDLMSELFQILAFARKSEQSSNAVILDVTSYPKRFFFPILRTLLNSQNVQNLIVTYTSPGNYPPDTEPLYEDIEPWKNLPGFGLGNIQNEKWVVSVGFLVESLRQYLAVNPAHKMQLLIPFPAPLAVLRRTWDAVANLELGHSNNRFEKFRVDTLDISSAFERLISLAGKPEQPMAFAPFGPKTTSVAMCLYAIQKNSSVYYPQPTVYHPEYTIGVQDNDVKSAVHAYWIKHNGENLYAI